MSRSSTPTLPWVIPMYEHMLQNLRVRVSDDTSIPSLRIAAAAGLEKLESYYAKATECQLNVIATRMGIISSKIPLLTCYQFSIPL
jgi:hypothetical protein